jgi:hypothetical protein
MKSYRSPTSVLYVEAQMTAETNEPVELTLTRIANGRAKVDTAHKVGWFELENCTWTPRVDDSPTVLVTDPSKPFRVLYYASGMEG